MASRVRETHGRMRDAIIIVVILSVFGFATFLAAVGYSPAAVTASVTAISLAPAELARRIRETPHGKGKADGGRGDR